MFEWRTWCERVCVDGGALASLWFIYQGPGEAELGPERVGHQHQLDFQPPLLVGGIRHIDRKTLRST